VRRTTGARDFTLLCVTNREWVAFHFRSVNAMNRSQLRANGHRSKGIKQIRWSRIFLLLPAAPGVCPLAQAQSAASGAAAPVNCPVQFLGFDPFALNVKIKNVSGKPIVRLVFSAALAEATEHWKWLHWNFDPGRPIRECGWNKLIKPGDRKRLSWYCADLDFQHGGGEAFVLTSVLFQDGSIGRSRTTVLPVSTPGTTATRRRGL
jgi:hypothetical protein